MAYIEVYTYDNGEIVKICSEHCGGYGGGGTLPVRYNNDIFICGISYSSSTGFLKNLVKYKNNEWQTVYSSYAQYDYESGQVVGYVVNGRYVSENDYYSFNNDVETGVLTADGFFDRSEFK